MKVKIEDITVPWYAPRGITDEEFINDLMRSLKDSGQWDPIMLRLNKDKEYELIAGLQRLTAAKRLGWAEIEANILDVSESQAALLAVETNLVRTDLQEMEEGKAIKGMMDKLGLNQKQIAKKLGRSQSWVSNRLSLALDLVEPVSKMIANNLLSTSQAIQISKVDPKQQEKFAGIIISKEKELGKKLNHEEIRAELKKFRNNTIYTIGYEGRSLEELIATLKRNHIELLLDIRESTKSLRKPEFSENFLCKNLEASKIKYLSRKDLGVPYVIRESFLKGGLSKRCFENWYRWHITQREENKIPELLETIKSSGKTALMCYEKDIKICHRNILANLIMETFSFQKRRDL